ncbi:13346_t:CDS:1 [Acaulospora morrowiae]|uniref:13346_t:CDS:1 n=1 Tax=Acaulospora morrowiae TaxID=94023 RepID=A0A9N8VU94_9GLOM|nr:13346_t:CDS:1 [Acaulospora morrowiae]
MIPSSLIADYNLWDSSTKFRPNIKDVLEQLNQPIPEQYKDVSSSIINQEHIAKIAYWISGSDSCEFHLAFSSNRDGKTIDSFHKKCDNKLKTILVLKVKGTSEILGGYNPIGWRKEKSTGYKETNESFIFSFNEGRATKSCVINPKKAIYCNRNYGPSFGFRDLTLCSNTFSSNMWFSMRKYYDTPIRSSGGSFEVENYEVFEIIDSDSDRFSNVDDLHRNELSDQYSYKLSLIKRLFKYKR